MNSFTKINPNNIPQHVCVIMDGNGRWAKSKGEKRTFGHKKGINTVQEILEASLELKISHLTLFAFSTENWDRPKYEVDIIMNLLEGAIFNYEDKLIKNGIRLNTIGNLSDLPEKCKNAIEKIKQSTNKNKKITLTIALSYSSRWEITEAIKKILYDYKKNKLSIEKVNEEMVNNYLCTNNLPFPDLLIRTGGEQRISNFLLWQLAYSELYFCNINWPMFKKDDFYKAILEYQNRERRFGKISEKIIE